MQPIYPAIHATLYCTYQRSFVSQRSFAPSSTMLHSAMTRWVTIILLKNLQGAQQNASVLMKSLDISHNYGYAANHWTGEWVWWAWLAGCSCYHGTQLTSILQLHDRLMGVYEDGMWSSHSYCTSRCLQQLAFSHVFIWFQLDGRFLHFYFHWRLFPRSYLLRKTPQS